MSVSTGRMCLCEGTRLIKDVDVEISKTVIVNSRTFVVKGSFGSMGAKPFLLGAIGNLISSVQVCGAMLTISRLKCGAPRRVTSLSVPSRHFRSSVLHPIFRNVPTTG